MSLHLLRAVPLVVLVSWAVAGYGLPVISNIPGLPDFEENVARATHRTVTPSGADPIYPTNHTLDGETQNLGSLPNADFQAASSNVGTPPTNSDLQSAPTSVVTVANGTFSTGTFANWTTSGTTTIQTGGPTGQWARLDSSGAFITSSAISVPNNAQEFVYDINYVATTGTSGVEVYILSGAGYATSTQIATDTCNSCGTWSTSFWDITAYRGQSIKIKFRRPTGTNQVGVDNVDVQQVFTGYDISGNVKRRVVGSDAHAEFSGSMTSAAFTVDASTQFLTVDAKKISSSAGWEIQVAQGPSFSTFTTLASGSLTTSWDLVRADASAYLGNQIKVRVRGVAGTIAIDDVGLMRVEVPSWPVIDVTTRLLDDGAGNRYLKYHGSITSGAIQIPPGTENLVLRARDDDATYAVQASVEVLTGTGYSTVNQTDTVSLSTSWATYRFGVGKFAGQTVKIRISTGSGTMNIDDATPFESVFRGWTQDSGDALIAGNDANGTYIEAADGGNFVVRSGWVSTAIAGTSSSSYRFYTLGFMVGTCQTCIYKAWWTNDQGQQYQILSFASNPGAYQQTQLRVSNSQGARGYFTIQGASGGRLYSLGDNVARQHLAEPFSRRVGLGIDTSTGAIHFSQTDVSLPGPIPIVFARYYNAHSDRLGPLGYRWSHSFETRLVFSDDDRGVIFGSGKEEFFTQNTNGSYLAVDPRIESVLVKNADSTYKLTTKDNLIYRFDTAGVLTSIEDLNGNDLVLAYNGQGRLTSVTGDGGSAITFGYDAQGRLQTVTDPLNAVFTYSYDASSDLTSVTDPEGGTSTNTYTNRLLDRVTDATSSLVVDNDYDGFARVTRQTDAAGRSFQLAYDNPGQGATLVTDPALKTASFYFDRFARTTDVKDQTDRIESYLYDTDGNLDKIVDPADAQWDFGFNAGGDLTTSSDPLGNPVSISWDPKHLPTTVTDSSGKVTTMSYDVKGNLTSITNPLNQTTTYTYDAAGNQTSATDPMNRITSYTYNPAGLRISMTNPLNKTWTYTYDAAGRLKTEQDPLGHVTTYFYDLLGRMTKVRDPLNRETTFLWDPVGHLLRVTNPAGEQTNWFYNSRGLVSKKVDPAGKETLYGYDDAHRMTSVTDPLGRQTTYAYDNAGRLSKVTDPLGKETAYSYDGAGRLASESDPLNRLTSYAYDAAGRLSQTTLPNGGIVSYTHDGDGRLLSVADALNHATTNTYDDAGRLATTTDPLGKTTTYSYDAAGRLTGQTDPLGHTTGYAYDAAGQQTTTTDALGHAATTAYDAAGRISSSTDATNRSTTYGYDAADQLVAVTNNAGQSTDYTYDPAGRLSSIELPSGALTTYAYNNRGLLTSESDPLLRQTTYAYDDAGQQISMTDPRAKTTSYLYDLAGRLKRITDHLAGEVALGYDAAGQLTSMTDPRGKTWAYGYNPLGQRNSVTDPLNRQTTWSFDQAGRMTGRVDARNISTSYAYDNADRMTSTTYPGGSIGYGYDFAGRRTSMTDVSGTTTWSYDNADRVTSVAAPAGVIGYGYDDADRRTSMSLPGSRTVGYTYNTAGRLGSMTDPGNRTVTFGYDQDGRRTTITRPNGVTTTTAYDTAGQETSIIHANAGGTLKSFSYTYDNAGNRTSVTTSDGTESYTYDALNRLTQVSYPGGPTVSYSYDAAGNRTSETRGGSTTNYTYDDAGQLTSVGSSTYGHDANGNLTSAGSNTFAWDFDNRLTSATLGGHSATYRYDGDGVRTRSTVDGATTDFLADRQGGVPMVVDDGSAAYLHADGLVSKVTGSGATWALNDALGSVRGLTDGAGTLTGSASYEAFGAPRVSTGVSTMFGFAGEQTDATGLVNLRARSLDPTTGRFLSADTVSPNAPGTGGYNLYAYSASNPVTWVDATGNSVAVPSSIAPIVAILLVGGAWIAAACTAYLLACIVVVSLLVAACVLSEACFDLARDFAGLFTGQGSAGSVIQPLPSEWALWEEELPETPVAEEPQPALPPVPIGGGGGSDDLVPVVIGENSWDGGSRFRSRVADAAALFRADNFEPLWVPPWPPGLRLEYNRWWIRKAMAAGRRILDIGPSSERSGYPACSSGYYCMEVWETRAYPNLAIRDYPGGGWQNGVRIIPSEAA